MPFPHGRLTLPLLLLCSACSSPTQPSPAVAMVVDPALQPALDQLIAIPVTAWSGQPMAQWIARAGAHRLEVGPLPSTLTAQYGHGVIRVSPTSVAEITTPRLAAVLAHELRHAEGYPHTCRLFHDLTLGEWGAWAVHIAVLRSLGLHGDANYLEATYVCRR